MNKLSAYLAERKTCVEQALAQQCTADAIPERLREAMRYSLLCGGKRLRAILVIAGAEIAGGTMHDVMPCACALEMIHAFSLVHDDLPAMDDDDLRRGQPTNHKVFGEAIAILAGDGLLSEAFSLLVRGPWTNRSDPVARLAVIGMIADATGGRGMVSGQLLDIVAEQHQLSSAEVEHLHRCKTGALIQAAVVSGAQLVGASETLLASLRRYGAAVGCAFQIADDLLSLERTTEELGKRAGNDVARQKATYPAMAGAAVARERMHALSAEAIDALADFDHRADPLRWLAQYVTERTS